MWAYFKLCVYWWCCSVYILSVFNVVLNTEPAQNGLQALTSIFPGEEMKAEDWFTEVRLHMPFNAFLWLWGVSLCCLVITLWLSGMPAPFPEASALQTDLPPCVWWVERRKASTQRKLSTIRKWLGPGHVYIPFLVQRADWIISISVC